MDRRLSWMVATAMVLAVTSSARAADPVKTGVAAVRGGEVYGQLCATCHGRYGRGDGPLAQNLNTALPDFTDPAWLAGRSNDAIAKALKGASHGPMAVANVVKPEVLGDAIAYLRTLSVPGRHVSVLAGRDIYNSSCQGCHGPHGDGQGPVAKFLEGTKPRDFTSPRFVIDGREDEVAQFIGQGAAKAAHGSTYMPEWASRLSPQQILDTVEFLKTFKHPKP